MPTTAVVDGALIVTLESGTIATVICAAAVTVTPPDVALAVIVAVPAETPLTKPVLLTDATPGAEELQLTVVENAAPN